VLANEFKEGGDLNVGGTRDDHVRREARDALAALSLGDIARTCGSSQETINDGQYYSAIRAAAVNKPQRSATS